MSAACNQSTGFTDDASDIQGFHAAELQGWDPDFVSGLAAAFDHSEVQDLSLSGQSWDADTVSSVYDRASHQGNIDDDQSTVFDALSKMPCSMDDGLGYEDTHEQLR